MAEENGAGGVYVLQKEAFSDGEPGTAWVDVATVTVPARTKRKTAIRNALKEAGLDVSEEIKVRLLDAESARVVPVRPRPPATPELEIG
jgi:hypothetical protein